MYQSSEPVEDNNLTTPARLIRPRRRRRVPNANTEHPTQIPNTGRRRRTVSYPDTTTVKVSYLTPSHEALALQRKREKNSGDKNMPGWDAFHPQIVEYQKYLTSADWAKKRLEALVFWGAHCRVCQTRRNLQVHHLSYKRLGDEPMEDLMIICRDHHSKLHKFAKSRTHVHSLRSSSLKFLREFDPKTGKIQQRKRVKRPAGES